MLFSDSMDIETLAIYVAATANGGSALASVRRDHLIDALRRMAVDFPTHADDLSAVANKLKLRDPMSLYGLTDLGVELMANQLSIWKVEAGK